MHLEIKWGDKVLPLLVMNETLHARTQCWMEKGKAMKTFRSLTQHRSHMFHKMHSIGWTSCNIEAGDSFIISVFLYVVTSRNVMTYSQVTMQHCDI